MLASFSFNKKKIGREIGRRPTVEAITAKGGYEHDGDDDDDADDGDGDDVGDGYGGGSDGDGDDGAVAVAVAVAGDGDYDELATNRCSDPIDNRSNRQNNCSYSINTTVPGILKSASVFGCPLHEQQLDEVFIISLKAVQCRVVVSICCCNICTSSVAQLRGRLSRSHLLCGSRCRSWSRRRNTLRLMGSTGFQGMLPRSRRSGSKLTK